jgi:two-component system, NarL family, nitrate/nitrite response regulator NarL
MTPTDRGSGSEMVADGATITGGRHAKVLIIDDHLLVGQSLASALRVEGFEPRLVPCPTPASVETALWWNPDVVLLDLNLGAYGEGTRLLPLLSSVGVHVIVVTGVVNMSVLSKCYDAGAAAVIEKHRSTDELVETIRRVLRGEDAQTATEPDSREGRRHRLEYRDPRFAPFTSLTPRERHVLAGLVDGLSAMGIATESGVSIWTVRAQIKSIFLRLGVNSQIEAVALARRFGWDENAAWS